MKIAIVGGTGKLGMGFVARFEKTTYEIAIGSRDLTKAREAAASVENRVRSMTNAEAASWCNIAIITVPYAAHEATLKPLTRELADKIIIDTTVPLNPKDLFQTATKSGKSAAEEAQELIDGAHVFAGFHTISHRILRKPEEVQDVLVAGQTDHKTDVIHLIRSINLRPIDTGPLEAARVLERMTALLISINRQNNVKESGLRVTGI